MRPRREQPLWLRVLFGPIAATAAVVLLAVAACNQARGAEPQTNAGSDGWPAPRGQAATGVESSGSSARRGNAAVDLAARQAQPVPRNRLRVINDTGHTLVLDVCCEGYPYGQPQVVPHGECAVWVWRRGETTVSDGTRIWGPRMNAIRAADGAVCVRLVP